MVYVVADRLLRDTNSKLHHLLLLVACGKETLNCSLFRISNARVSFPFCTSFHVPQKRLDVFGRSKDAAYVGITLIAEADHYGTAAPSLLHSRLCNGKATAKPRGGYMLCSRLSAGR